MNKNVTFVNTYQDNLYAIMFIMFVILSSILYVGNLLPAYDPSVLQLPVLYSKAIYLVGGVSGLVVYAGMLMARYSSRTKTALKWELAGLGTHVVALLTLAASVSLAGASSAWILGTSLILAIPHIRLCNRLIKELARYDTLMALYIQTRGQVS